MSRLKSRDKFPPGGFTYYQPETRWRPPQGVSFDTVVNAIIAHRRANPMLRQKGWSTEYSVVADEVDAFNAKNCESLGALDYVQGGASPPGQAGPKPLPLPLPLSVRHVVVGAETIVEMFGEQGPVTQELANARAAVCAKCPKNEQGDWTRFFTVPAAGAVRKMLGWVKDQKLETPFDGELRVCTACYCPCKLKVWARLDHILAHMPKADQDELAPDCWIRTEQKKNESPP